MDVSDNGKPTHPGPFVPKDPPLALNRTVMQSPVAAGMRP